MSAQHEHDALDMSFCCLPLAPATFRTRGVYCVELYRVSAHQSRRPLSYSSRDQVIDQYFMYNTRFEAPALMLPEQSSTLTQ